MSRGKFRKGEYVWIEDENLKYTAARVLHKFRRGERGEAESEETGQVIFNI